MNSRLFLLNFGTGNMLLGIVKKFPVSNNESVNKNLTEEERR